MGCAMCRHCGAETDYLGDHWVIVHADGAPLHDASVNADLHNGTP